MLDKDYLEQGLNGEAPLKVILCGSVQTAEQEKVGVVSMVYATLDKEAAAGKIQELFSQNPQNYYMVYSVPFDVDLTTLTHYPSVAITKDDLQ